MIDPASDDSTFLESSGIDPDGFDAPVVADRIASYMSRAFARSIDFLVVAILALTFTLPFVDSSGENVPRWVALVVSLAWVVYEGGTVAILGRTVGKMAMGLAVVDVRTGSPAGPAKAVLRAAVVPALLPLVSFFALLAYPTATIDPVTRRGLLDRIAGTVVVARPA